MNEPAIVVQKAYDWTLWIIPKVENFPKSHRFTIGEPMVRASIELLLHLVDASCVFESAGPLRTSRDEAGACRWARAGFFMESPGVLTNSVSGP